MDSEIKLYRLVWDRAGLTMRSDWSIHYSVVREFLIEKANEMPGTEPRIETGIVQDVPVLEIERAHEVMKDLDNTSVSFVDEAAKEVEDIER